MYYGTTGKHGIQSVKCCVVFDAGSGDIVHVHRVVDAEGAPVTPDHAVTKQALDLVENRGLDIAVLRTLSVPSEDLRPGYSYHVDVTANALVRGGRRT
ncbi:hypothetical protein ACWC0A_05785 [Streptomyces scopuliridis]